MEKYIMTKLGKSLLQGAKEALTHAQGDKSAVKVHQVKIPKKINVSAIRDKLNMSQSSFAKCFGFSQRTIEKWEQGVRQPAGAARAYLIVIDRDPQAVRLALSGEIKTHTHKKVTHKEKA